MVQLYTAGTPRTIHQFWHHCYFEDLWAYMGNGLPRAATSNWAPAEGTLQCIWRAAIAM